MEFRRINALPPYVFGIIDALKIEARRAGEDVIDLGFGNPDIPSPDDRGREAGRGGRATRATTATRRAAASRSCASAIADLYRRKFGVELDPETEVVHHHRRQGGLLAPDVGAARPGRRRARAEPVVPDPHLGPDPRRRRGAPRAPRPRAGLLRQPARGVGGVVAAAAGHRAVVPAQPDDRVRRPRVHDRAWSTSPASTTCCSCTTSPTPTSASTATTRRRSCRCPGAKDVAVELYTLTKSFSMAGWRVGFLLGNAEVVAALAKLKSYLDYGTFQPIQIAATVAMNEAPDYPKRGERDLPRPARRADRRPRPHRLGDREAARARCSCGRRSPSPTRRWAASSSPRCSCRRPRSRSRPASGFGPGGEGFVRFALVENEQRIGQAVRGIKRALTKLG